MLVSFDRDQRKVIAEKFMELANLAVFGLVLAQFLSSRFSVRAVVIGLIVFTTGYTGAFILMKGGGK